MDSDPEQAADRLARAVIMAIFAVILAVAISAAFITTLEDIDTRHASDDAPRYDWPSQTASAAR